MSDFLSTLVETVNPATQPVGVKLIRDPDEVPIDQVRVRDQRLTICQQIAYSRMYKWSTWTDAASAHCVLGAGVTGLIERPERVVSGEVNTGVYQQDRPAAAAMQAQMPRVGERMAGVLTYPLVRPVAGMTPDVVVVYLNTAQAMRLVQAFLYREGGEFVMRSSGDAGVCSRGVGQVYRSGEPTIEIPCLGDRRFAMAQDHELLVGIPASWLERTAEGLRQTHKAGIRYPIPFQIPAACELPADFVTAEADLGLKDQGA